MKAPHAVALALLLLLTLAAGCGNENEAKNCPSSYGAFILGRGNGCGPWGGTASQVPRPQFYRRRSYATVIRK